MLLAQNISEIVPIVAIALISLIFVVYLIVLKKNGWIGGQSNFYRCPNQECKKMFKKPIELEDLSKTPPRVYPACPECGADVNTFFGSSTEKVPKIWKKNLIHEKKPEVRSVETPNRYLSYQKKPGLKSVEKKSEVRSVETPNRYLSYQKKPGLKSVEKKSEVRSVETPNQNQQQFSILRERVPETKPSRDGKKTDTVDVPGCEYSFGYLAGRNIKQEGIPAICLSCPRTLECLIHS